MTKGKTMMRTRSERERGFVSLFTLFPFLLEGEQTSTGSSLGLTVLLLLYTARCGGT